MKRITIVEDKNHYAEKIRKVLEDAGHTVTHINPWVSWKPKKILTFDECIKAIEESNPEAILLDVDFDLFSHLRDSYDGGSVAERIQGVELINISSEYGPDECNITSGKWFRFKASLPEHKEELLELIG